MAKDWEWKASGTAAPDNLFVAKRGSITLIVYMNLLSKRWSFEAGVASPGAEEIDGVRIGGDETYATKELAQLAAIEALREFVEQLHADFRGAE